MNLLKNALKNFFTEINEEIFEDLAKALIYTLKNEELSYNEVKKLITNDPEDLLLLAFELRLLIPTKSFRNSLEWDNKLFLPTPEAKYKMPKIIRILVQNAFQAGVWEPKKAITKIFKEMGEPDWKKIQNLVQELQKHAESNQINGSQIKKSCSKLGLENKVNTIIAELKGSDIINPRLGDSFLKSIKKSSPYYELNPSLFRKSIQ